MAALGGCFWISGYTLSAMSKILVSVDDKLLARIDRAASSAGLSRSAYLARLAARDLGEERGPEPADRPNVHSPGFKNCSTPSLLLRRQRWPYEPAGMLVERSRP